MIHGPGNKGNLNLLYNLFILKRIPYPLVAFDNRRSFLSVENLCFTIKELLDRNDIPSGVYNIADSESLSTTEVITLLSLSTGIKPLFLNIPQGIIKFVAEIGDLFKLGLGSQNLEKLTENYVVSNQKIKQSLNKELPVSARDGILKTGQSFR
jgi:nucleoside-diphosphate-sugar epimerase